MRLANIPPPLALFDISLSENAVDVAVTVIKLRETLAFICVLFRQAIVLFEWDLTANPSQSPYMKWHTQLSREGLLGAMYQQITFSDQKTISILSSDADGSSIHFVNLDNGLVDEDIFLSGEEIRGLITPVTSKDSKNIMLLTKGAALETKIPPSKVNINTSVHRLSISPILSPRVEAVSFRIEATDPKADGSRPHDIVFGFSDNGSLFANERLLARNCTSLLVTPAHLIFTTGNHLLKFVHMTTASSKLLRSD